MHPNRDQALLLDIARAAELVQEFKKGMTKPAFIKDLKTQSAILHQLMVMGEAVKRLSEDFRFVFRNFNTGKPVLQRVNPYFNPNSLHIRW